MIGSSKCGTRLGSKYCPLRHEDLSETLRCKTNKNDMGMAKPKTKHSLRWFALVLDGQIIHETYASDAKSALAKFKALRGKLPEGSTVEKSTGKNQLEPPDYIAHLVSNGYSREEAERVVAELLGVRNPKCPRCHVFLEVVTANRPWSSEHLVCAQCNGTYCRWSDVPQ